MIFVSHREAERILAESLVELLISSLAIPENTLRCTSVPGFQLPYGRTISEQLKDDINRADAVFIILTARSLESKWVLFELGASWALGKVIIPILGPSLTEKDLPSLISQYPMVKIASGDAASRLRDAIIQVARELHLNESSSGRDQAKLEDFVKVFRGWKDSATPAADGARAFELGWLILYAHIVTNTSIAARLSEIEFHASGLGLQLPPSWRDVIQGDDSGSLQDLTDSLGGQIMATNYRLTSYYQAGLNIVASVANNDETGLDNAISALNLPGDVTDAAHDLSGRADHVHHYFLSILHDS
jgi:TIR domain